jgi:hypothetical protein
MKRLILAGALIAALAPAAAAATEPVTLVCTMVLIPKEGGTKGDVTYAVDFDKKTVNGMPATITDNSIEVVNQMPWGLATTKINRVTGGAQWLNGDGILANGDCVKAPPPRRF